MPFFYGLNIMIKYAGIGARDITAITACELKKYGEILGSLEYILRSGAARGSDAAFESGCDVVNGPKEIYLPHKKFNNHDSLLICELTPKIEYIASRYYHSAQAYSTLSTNVKRLMCRNCMQVLGSELNDPVDFVLCWTNDGREYDTTRETGGTGQAIRIANAYDIPVFNLNNPLTPSIFSDFLETLKQGK